MPPNLQVLSPVSICMTEKSWEYIWYKLIRSTKQPLGVTDAPLAETVASFVREKCDYEKGSWDHHNYL